MPKGSKVQTVGYTTFHRCACGYDIEGIEAKLIEIKKRLHRKKCDMWKGENVIETNYGILDVPRCQSHHSINRDVNINMNVIHTLTTMVNKAS